MITFTVEDVGHDGQHASVRDQHGRLHVVRVTGSLPQVGDILFGQEAVPGPRVLVNQASHKPLQVHFVVLGSTQGQALELLHPLAVAAGDDLPEPAFAAGGDDGRQRRGAAWAVPFID